MALKCGIIGITGSGKTTLFNCLSNTKASTGGFSGKANMGIIIVPDNRLYELEKLQPSEKIVHALITIVDIPGLVTKKTGGDTSGNQLLSEIRNTDALIHVVRCFDYDNFPHPDITVDPVRDIENIELELQARDIDSVEKKLIKLEKQSKGGDKEARKGIEILNIYKAHLESLKSARSLDLNEQDKKYADDLFLLSAKPVLYIANVDPASAVSGNHYSEKMKNYLSALNSGMLVIAAKTEAEIAELVSENDRKMFLEDAGLAEPGVDKLIKAAYSLLNLQTFFTVGPKEIRAWTITKGAKAPQAAGVIHSDLERGFIRAEVIKYEDFITLKSEQACKEKGKLAVEGKNYIVEDGDLLHIRFNV